MSLLSAFSDINFYEVKCIFNVHESPFHVLSSSNDLHHSFYGVNSRPPFPEAESVVIKASFRFYLWYQLLYYYDAYYQINIFLIVLTGSSSYLFGFLMSTVIAVAVFK